MVRNLNKSPVFPESGCLKYDKKTGYRPSASYSSSMASAAETLARVIDNSYNLAVLTGAGISVPSGIPDFRSENGLWTKYQPERVASMDSFRNTPAVFWDFYLNTWHTLHLVYEPNEAHYALARLEQMGKITEVITQNIDGLHQKAGNSTVIEVHGTTRTWSCTSCEAVYDADEANAALLVAEDGHRDCSAEGCDAPVKPDVILFGEQLPGAPFYAAGAAIDKCDTLLCIGSSLTVQPVASWPARVVHDKKFLAILSPGWTAFNHSANMHVDASAEILAEAVELLA